LWPTAWLEIFGDKRELLTGLTPAKIRHFAAEAQVLDAAELKDVTTPKRYTLLLCLIHRAQIQARDDLAEMFLKRIARFHVQAQQELELIRARHRALTEELIDTLADMLRVVEANPSDAELGRQVKSTVARHGDLAELLAGCDAIAAYSGDNHLPLLWRFYRSHRAVLFRLARTVAFDATTTDRALLKALQTLLAHEDAVGDWLPADIEVDLSFASERTVLARVDRRRRIARRHFEVCVFSNLATGLKSGDIAIRGSDAYADYREQLLPWSYCEPAVADYCGKLSIPSDAHEFVARLRAWLAETAERVDAGFSTNADVGINTRGEPVLKRRLRPSPSPTAVRADIEGNYLKALAEVAPGLAERVRGGKREQRFVGGPIDNYFHRPYGPGWALVGDAGYKKDPCTAAGITDAFRDAELLAEAIDAGFSGRRSLEDALADYERQRNEASLPMYEFTTQLATTAPPPPEMQQLLAALHGNQEATNRFFGVFAQTVPAHEFFAPDNVGRIMGQATPADVAR
jgi:hypothetical protein